MKKTKYIVFSILFTILLIIFSTTNVHAFVGELICEEPGGDGGGGGGGGDGGGGGGGGASCVPGPVTTCNVHKTGEDEHISLHEDIYDTENKYIGSALSLDKSYEFVAGRFVGIDAYEEYKKTFYVSMNPTCIQGVYVTHYYQVYHSRTCREYEDGNWYTYDCGWWETRSYVVLECYPCSPNIAQCRGEADQMLEGLANSVDVSPSYVAKRQDVNDINKGINNEQPTIVVNENPQYRYIDRGYSEPASITSLVVWRTVTMRYTYNLETAWIDPISGNVKYENATVDPVTTKDKETYIKVPEMYTYRNGMNVQIGQYFIPLNATSTDLMRYYLTPNTSKPLLSQGLCNNLIDEYSTSNAGDEHWSTFLLTKNGANRYATSSDANAAKAQVRRDNGCRTGMFAQFHIIQNFYNETPDDKDKNKKDLAGYHFYYRPIDHTEPFPNGLDNDSYWKGLYDPNKNAITIANAAGRKLDLDDSYKQITYATNENYSLGLIRQYNSLDENLYTSWEKMTVSATSKFITEGNGITRYNCQTYYALGCGPENNSWAECQKRKTEICK